MNFDSCVQSCWNSSDCVMVYESSKTTCQLFTIPNITTIQKTTSGSRVAFRIKTSTAICPSAENSPLLSGKFVASDVERGDSSTTFNQYISYTVKLTNNTFKIVSTVPVNCFGSYTFVRRSKDIWCIGLYIWTTCVNQTQAIGLCQLNGARLSGIENGDEFQFVQKSSLAYLFSRIENTTYNKLGFWVDGTRKSTCQYPKLKSAICNGTNEFTFNDDKMSSPGGYQFLSGQPDGINNKSANSNCLYHLSQKNGETGIDDTPCSMRKSAGMCYAGVMCGMEPFVISVA